jgi:serine/threonine protein kinase
VADRVPPVPGDFAAGAQIAGYRLAQQIGWGGMAVVYRALDVRLDRWVALKILAPEIARDESFRQRFISESRAAAAVDHPHIIPVFEAGEAGGALFIAMRYVSGGDVRTLCRRLGPLDPARTSSIVGQVASALDAAHAVGLVHRDVKPANMLLGAVAGSGHPDHVYLSDFGLSKQALATAGLTQTGQFVGTLDYMAPEQIESRPVDGRTDLYALGCAAFEMLAGQPPFQRGEDLGLLFAQLSAAPPLLTARRPDLPPAVDRVLARALAKSPDDRQLSCLDFAASLRTACGLEWGASGQLQSGRPGTATRLAGSARGTGPPAPRNAADGGPWPPAPQAPRQPSAPPTAQPPPRSRQPARRPGQPSPAPTAVETGPGAPGGGPAGQDRYGQGRYGQRPYAQSRYDPSPGQQAQYGPASDQQATYREPSYGQRPYRRDSSGPGSGSGPPYLPPAPYPPPVPRDRSRGRPFAIGAIAVLIILAAVGTFAYLRHATGAPSGTAATSSPAIAASPAGRARPAGTVTAYIAAINRHDYARAWNLGGRNSTSSFAAFKQGFSTTAKDTLKVESVSGNVVIARLSARQTDGSVKTYHGAYTVQNGVITKFDVRQTS